MQLKRSNRAVEVMALSSKFRPPRQLPNVVVRREIDKIETSIPERFITAVVAPSGYGKSTVMAQWRSHMISRESNLVWLSLDDDDQDIGQLVSNLCVVFEGQCGVNVETYTINNVSHKNQRIFSQLLSLLTAIRIREENFVLFLDDLQRIDDKEAITVIEEICKHAPENLSLVLASRRDLPNFFNNFIGRGQLLMVDVQMLAFSLKETIDFLRIFGRSDLTLSHIDQLHFATEGWVSGLHLACHILKKSKSLSADIEKFSGETAIVSRFIWDTMILELPQEDLVFLEKLSLLAIFTPQSCEYIFQDDNARKRIKTLSVQIPFVICLDEFSETYRLHSLLRNFLAVRIVNEDMHDIHLRAFEYCCKTKQYTEAINHALIIDAHDSALTLIEECARDVVSTGDFALISSWVKKISVSRASRSLSLQKCMSIGYCVSGQKYKAREYLDQIRVLTKDQEEAGTLSKIDQQEIAIIEAIYYISDEQLTKGLKLAQQYDWVNSGIDPWIKAIGCNLLAMCNAFLLRTEEVRRYLTLARTYHEDTKGHFRQIYSLCYYGVLAEAEGKISEADTYYRSAFDKVIEDKQERGLPADHTACFMLPSLYERGRFSEIRVLMANRVRGVLYNTLTMIMVPAITAFINMRFAMNMDESAEALLAEFEGLANTDNVKYAQSAVILLKLNLSLYKNNVKGFQNLIKQHQTLIDDCAEGDPIILDVLNDHALFVRAKNYIFLRRGHNIVEDMKILHDRFKSGGTRRDLLKSKIYYALCVNRRDGHKDAKTLILGAVRLGADLGYTQTFVDIIKIFPDLDKLLKILLSDEKIMLADKMFIETVFDFFKDQNCSVRSSSDRSVMKLVPVKPIIESDVVLSPREQEILKLVASGYTNKKISLSLSITVETVKWHLKQVFQKLNAQNRTHAVKQAEAHGLLGRA